MDSSVLDNYEPYVDSFYSPYDSDSSYASHVDTLVDSLNFRRHITSFEFVKNKYNCGFWIPNVDWSKENGYSWNMDYDHLPYTKTDPNKIGF